MPRCAWCTKTKPPAEFRYNRNLKRYHSYCRPCDREYRKDYRNRNPKKLKDKDKRDNLRKRYGITLEEYNALLAAQGFRCALCPAEHGKAGHRVGGLVVDHDHKTGRIRGLLCQACNLFIGSTRLNPEYLAKMLAYLSEPSQPDASAAGK